MTGLRTPNGHSLGFVEAAPFRREGKDAGKESSNFKVSFSGSLLQGLTMAMEDEGQAKEIPLATA